MPDNVIAFPVERARTPTPVTCMDCQNVTAGVLGLYCRYFNEQIDFEDIAEDCSEFEPI